MSNQEPSRCKRCGVWVYDGSPLCASCTKRHNEVYNHFYSSSTNKQINNKVKNKKSNLRLVLFLSILVVCILAFNIYRNNQLYIESFPPHGKIIEIDELIFNQNQRSLLNLETDSGFGYIIKILNIEDNRTIVSFFLHPNSIYSLNIPIGNFRISYRLVKKWDSKDYYSGTNDKSYISPYIYIFSEETGYSLRIDNNGHINYFELDLLNK